MRMSCPVSAETPTAIVGLYRRESTTPTSTYDVLVKVGEVAASVLVSVCL